MRASHIGITLLLFIASLPVGCVKEQLPPERIVEGGMVICIPASFSVNDLKTSLGSDLSVLWSPDDSVKFHYTGGISGEQLSCILTPSWISEDRLTAYLSGSLRELPANDYVYAVFPASADVAFDIAGTNGSARIPHIQEARVNSFGSSSNISLAASLYSGNNTRLSLKNVGSLLEFSLSDDANSIQSIEFTSYSSPLAGIMDYEYNDQGDLGIGDIRKQHGSIILNGPFENGAKYYIVSFPGNHTGGFTLEFRNKAGQKAIINTKTPLTTERNNVYSFGEFSPEGHWWNNIWSRNWMDAWSYTTDFAPSAFLYDNLAFVPSVGNPATTGSSSLFLDRGTDNGGEYVSTNGILSFTAKTAGVIEISGHGYTNSATSILYRINGGDSYKIGSLASTGTSQRTTIRADIGAKSGDKVEIFSKEAGRAYYYNIKYSGELVKESISEKDILFDPAFKRHYHSFLLEYSSSFDESMNLSDVLSSISPDGKWPDINYSDRSRSTWEPVTHPKRMAALARYYNVSHDVRYRDAAIKAAEWWCDHLPSSDNWWYNQISAPKYLAIGALLLQAELTDAQIDKISRCLEISKIEKDGQNRIWLSEVVLLRGLLTEDAMLVAKAYNYGILSALVITEPGVEGIQEDYSFHAHGPQLQSGNYGLSLAESFGWLNYAFKGTTLEFSGEKRDLVENYIRNGLNWFDWNNYFDFSACGRQVGKNAQQTKSRMLSRARERLGIIPSNRSGAKFFHCSDFAVYRNSSWYASVRMQSSRTTGYESNINGENILAYFSADGALLPRRRGDEYENICPCWDWHRVPGVTAYDDGAPLENRTASLPYNKSKNVFAVKESDFLAVAMELDRDGLKAHKSWFFYGNGIVCLGSGISRNDASRVTTSVNQVKKSSDFRSSDKWVYNDGITYIPLNSTEFTTLIETRVADWSRIGIGSGNVSLEMLDLYIDHGAYPQSCCYAYAVMMKGESPEDAFSKASNIEIVSNTYESQIVKIGDLQYSIDWNNNVAQITVPPDMQDTGEQFDSETAFEGTWINN